ncbi:MAG: hypothetical protein ACKO0Z_02790 [Betaproteobacteria bacterium]
MKLHIGVEVEWSSSSNGSTTTKRGVVEDVIKPKTTPTHAQKKEADAYGLPRDHESYLVRVPTKTGKGKGRLYWPRVSAIRVV